MNVVLLTSARGQRPSTIVALREQLGIQGRHDITLSVVGLYAPKRPLPVDTNLVVGPDVTLRRSARELPTSPVDLEDDGSADLTWLEAMKEAGMAPPRHPAPPTEPVYHPARVARAVAWRARRARLAVRQHPGVSRVRNSTKVRKAKNKIAPGGVGTRYAVACLRAANVGELVAAADVVVALDANTYRAAWLLARRHTLPAVVAGTAAGKRVIAERLEVGAAG